MYNRNQFQHQQHQPQQIRLRLLILRNLFYMQQRGLNEGQSMSLAVNGFINDLVREFPMEYSVELKRLIDLEMEGSVG